MKKIITGIILVLCLTNYSYAQVDTSKNDKSAMKQYNNNRNKPKEKMNKHDSTTIMNDKMNKKKSNPKKDSIPTAP